MVVGVPRVCPLFTKVVDCLEPLSASAAQALKGEFGVGAVGRYLETLTPTERDALFAAGLPILPLSEAPLGPLSASLGREVAADLLARADALGVPVGAHVMVDFEAQQGDAQAYADALTGPIALAGYVPLAYVGAGQLLSGAELFALPSVHLYWRGGSVGVAEPACGFAIWQVPPLDQVLAGARVDVSLTGADAPGRVPILWAPG